jgi:hypothetical protein
LDVTPFNYTGAVQAWSGRNPMGCIGLTTLPCQIHRRRSPLKPSKSQSPTAAVHLRLIAITVLE